MSNIYEFKIIIVYLRFSFEAPSFTWNVQMCVTPPLTAARFLCKTFQINDLQGTPWRKKNKVLR